MPSKHINVKDRVMNDEIDLSMSELVEIPVKDIANIKNATSLDVSNNNIKLLPKNFTILTHLTKLDLSRNSISELPENFGDLIKLRHLDLYQNQLQYLPLSFCKLKGLRWLDVKNNPLKPTIAQVAGPCLDTKDCQACAKKIVTFYTKLQEKVTIESENREKQRKKQLEINMNIQKDKKEKVVKKKNKQKRNINNQEFDFKTTLIDKTNMENEKEKFDSCEDFRQSKSSLCRIFFLIFLSLLLLFVFTSLDYKHSKTIKENIKTVYRSGVELLPGDYELYASKFGDYIYCVHEKIGKFSDTVLHLISKERFVSIYDNILPVITNATNRMRNIFKGFLEKE